MNIQGLNKLTLVDYPHKLACLLFTGGCNFCCPFCQNGSLVINAPTKPYYSEEEILKFLKQREGILEGVCISGGEPTLNPDLADFIKEIKKMNYCVKLDTNGYTPKVLSNLLENHLLDYVAMDIKNSPEKYPLTTGTKHLNIDNINTSIQLLSSYNIEYEFRTTVVKQFHTDEDFHSIGKWLQGQKNYYLQSFRLSEGVIDPSLSAPEKEDLIRYRDILSKYITNVSLRDI